MSEGMKDMKKRFTAIVLTLALSLGMIPSTLAAPQSDLTAASVSGWGAHNFVGDSETVASTVTPNADGSITVSGSTV